MSIERLNREWTRRNANDRGLPQNARESGGALSDWSCEGMTRHRGGKCPARGAHHHRGNPRTKCGDHCRLRIFVFVSIYPFVSACPIRLQPDHQLSLGPLFFSGRKVTRIRRGSIVTNAPVRRACSWVLMAARTMSPMDDGLDTSDVVLWSFHLYVGLTTSCHSNSSG